MREIKKFICPLSLSQHITLKRNSHTHDIKMKLKILRNILHLYLLLLTLYNRERRGHHSTSITKFNRSIFQLPVATQTLCKRYILIRQPPIPVGGQEQHLNFVNKLKVQPKATQTHQIFLRNHKISALLDKGPTERTNHKSPYNNIHYSYRPHGLGK